MQGDEVPSTAREPSDADSATADALRAVLPGDTRMAAMMRGHDWSASPLGPPASWPAALRPVVRLLLESRVAMFVAWGPELGLLYNDEYADILGAKHPRALGARFADAWAEIWPDISPLVDAAMDGRAIYREDLPLLMNRQGEDEQTWFTFSYSPVRGDDGRVQGMFCAVWETTQKVVAERALHEANRTLERRVAQALAERELLADIVESTDAIVQVLDLQGRWLAFNRAAQDELRLVHGVQPQVGRSLFEALAGEPAQQAASMAIWRRALGGEEFTEHASFGDPAHLQRTYEVKFNVLRDREGRRIGAYQFARDVTARLREQERLKLAEDSLRRAQKLESLGQLTGGVAHDFNNLLQVMANGIALIEARVGAVAVRTTLDGMRRAIKRGTDLTRHLLAFSRRQPMNPEPVDLARELLGMREMLTRSLRGDMQVDMSFDPGLWPVEVDPGELEVAVLNLCVNARDAMPTGGIVAITADNLAGIVVDGRRGAFVRLRIKDTGTGMSEDVRARAFDPFFTTKETGMGSGLGLAQVYGFAKQSGGCVQIDSAPGRGTTVTLLLPRTLRQPSPEAEAARAIPHAAGSLRGRVLFVEDDPEVASLTAEMLRGLGLDVLHVSTVAAALGALANEREIDIVLSDVMMPGGASGVDLAREVQLRRPGLSVVLTTGYELSATQARAEGIALLLKPYGADELAAAIAGRLRRAA